MTADMIRPRAAAAQFHVARSTLAAWADAALIGTSKIGRVRYYRASDIADLIATHEARRKVVPAATAQPDRDESWRDYFGVTG